MRTPKECASVLAEIYVKAFDGKRSGAYRIDRDGLNRHSPNSLRVCGNHNTVPPSRERNCIRRLPMT